MSVDEGALDEDTPSEKSARAALAAMDESSVHPLDVAGTPRSTLFNAAIYINVRDLSEALTETLARAQELKTEESTLKYIRVIRDKLDTIAPPDIERQL